LSPGTIVALGKGLLLGEVGEASQTFAYGTYVLEVGFACVMVASLGQFKELADRMPDPEQAASAGCCSAKP
jgi:hypothetical protein